MRLPSFLSPDRRQLRQFGVAALIVLTALGIWARVGHTLLGVSLSAATASRVALGLWVAGGLGGLLALLAPRALLPAYVALSVVTFPIGVLISHVVLAVLFFAVVTPIGLALRATRRDELGRRFDRSRPSYWSPRPPTTDRKRIFRQF